MLEYNHSKPLHNLRALVLGASQGIGRAIAEEFAVQGASVLAVARNESKLMELVNKLEISNSQVHTYQSVDLTSRNAIKAFADTLSGEQPFHIVVNNTGGPASGLITGASPDAFLEAVNNHIVAYHTLLQALLPSMKSVGYGRIINIISTSVITPIKGLGVSNTLRAAVANWGRTLADELAINGITVNNLLPGMIKTERLDSLFATRAVNTGVSIEEVEKGNLAKIPAGRFGDAAEIAYVAAFLASPAASYVNGVNLPVDGGRLACQ